MTTFATESRNTAEWPRWQKPIDNAHTAEAMAAHETGLAEWLGVGGLLRVSRALGTPAYRHVLRVSVLSGNLYANAGVSAGEVTQAELDAFLHDMGKTVPAIRDISERTGDLSPLGRLAMRTHAVLGERAVRAMATAAGDAGVAMRLRAAAPIARYHHTSIDAIPPELRARVRGVQVVDEIDAVTSPADRPYLVTKGEFATPDGAVRIDAVAGFLRRRFPPSSTTGVPFTVEDALDAVVDLKQL